MIKLSGTHIPWFGNVLYKFKGLNHIATMVLKNALAIINESKKDSSGRFNIEFLTYDKNRGTGGKLKTIKKAYVRGSAHDQKENSTVTIQSDSTNHPIPVHIRLIMKLNNEIVI